MSRNTTKISQKVKAGLALRGKTLAGWAHEKQYPYSTVWQAVHETRSGPISKDILKKLEELHA